MDMVSPKQYFADHVVTDDKLQNSLRIKFK